MLILLKLLCWICEISLCLAIIGVWSFVNSYRCIINFLLFSLFPHIIITLIFNFHPLFFHFLSLLFLILICRIDKFLVINHLWNIFSYEFIRLLCDVITNKAFLVVYCRVKQFLILIHNIINKHTFYSML